MSDEQQTPEANEEREQEEKDVEAHKVHSKVPFEADEPDVEGHKYTVDRVAFEPDVEGHRLVQDKENADTEEPDVEGHRLPVDRTSAS